MLRLSVDAYFTKMYLHLFLQELGSCQMVDYTWTILLYLFSTSGRRGIFDGVMESIYQHWKHREVVKVITFQRRFFQVVHTAKVLEAESGGILVSIEKVKEGHAIMIYRGKNYKRPKLAPLNLLNKRDALSESLEMQRIGVSKSLDLLFS